MQDEKKLKQEALAEWREHPVTRRLLGTLRKLVEANKKELMERGFSQGGFDPDELALVKAQEQLVENFEETNAEEWNDYHEQLWNTSNGL